MNAKDLMIGDLAEFHCGYGKVTGITDAGVHFEDRFGPGIASGAEPIPLTSEILKKNGFKDSGFLGELLYKDWQIMSDCHHLAARCWDGWNIDIPCEFVHQLQHALHLCGIDKTIEL